MSRTAIVVAGMHRTGTSALTRVVNLLGAELPRTPLPPSEDNEPGHWESLRFARLNDEILAAASLAWDDPAALPATWLTSPTAAELRERLAETIEEEFGDADFVVVKDPRICRLLPLWLPALDSLGYESRFALTVRNPLEVAASLKARNEFSTAKSLLLWLRYVIDAERATRSRPRAFVAYEDLLASWESVTQRLSSELAIGWPRYGHRDRAQVERFLSADDRHHAIADAELEARPEVVSWVRKVHTELRKACAPHGRPRARVLDQVAAALDPADALYGPLLAESQLDRERERERLEERIEAHRQAAERRDERIDELEIEAEAAQSESARLERFVKSNRERFVAAGRESAARFAAELESARRQADEFESELAKERAERLGLKSELEGRRAEEKALRDELAAARGQIEQLVPRLKSRTRELATVREQLRQTRDEERLDREMLEAIRDRALTDQAVRPRLRARAGALTRRMARMAIWILRPPFRQGWGYVRAYRAIRRQGGFDEAFYMAKYPDVGESGIDPLMHYVQFGAREARDPSPYLSGRAYLAAHPELRGSGENPLLHWNSQRHALKRARGGAGQPAGSPSPAVQRTARPPTGRRRRIVVLSWDMTHNPAGRAYLLADMLSREYDVTLAGPAFPRYGKDVWGPVRDSAIDKRVYPGREFPQHLAVMKQMAAELECDAVVVSKPRLPSYGVAMMMKAARGTPIVLDVDDHELAFFPGARRAGIGELDQREAGDEEAFRRPFGCAWTELCDGLIPSADAVTVSNAVLHAKYGGTVIPHARDERAFDPARFDRDMIRARYGISPEDRVVLFLGTPRLHKGLFDILDALDEINDPRNKLCLIGTITEPPLRDRLTSSPRTVLVPDQPFAELPANLLVGDVVCLLQDPDHPIAHYQMPAKVTDALAMGIPILARITPPLHELAAQDLLTPVTPSDLARRLEEALARTDPSSERGRSMRTRFLEGYSYRSVAPRLGDVVGRVIDDSRPLSDAQRQVLDELDRRFDPPHFQPRAKGASLRKRALVPTGPAASLDFVCFWKQNDTGIYGRRHEMLVKYLARSDDVRKVVHFDAPMAVTRLLRHRRAARRPYPTHDGLIYRNTLRRAMRATRGNGDVRDYTYLYRTDDAPRLFRGLRGREDFIPYVREVMAAEGVGADGRKVVLIGWPTLEDLPQVIEDVPANLSIADVVDDNRTWLRPGTKQYTAAERNYRETLGRADLVLANCAPVADAVREFRQEVYIVPNACEHPSEFPLRARPPSELRGLDGPIVGYSGNLSSRIDIPLLELAALSRPDWNLVLIGSAHLDQSVMALDRFPNVHFLGVKPYPQVTDYVRYFDVAMIPHTIDAMTATMHPLKAILYTSLGVPVVATQVANLDSQSSVVMTARHHGFIRAIDETLTRQAGATGGANGSLAAADIDTWESRAERVLTLVRERL